MKTNRRLIIDKGIVVCMELEDCKYAIKGDEGIVWCTKRDNQMTKCSETECEIKEAESRLA